MITYLGSLSMAGVVPIFASSLATMKASILGQLQDLASDVFAIQGDMVSLEADASALVAELAGVTGLADGIAQQLAAGPLAVIRGIEAAIAAILDGSSLLALKQAVLGGPAAVLASLQAALAEVQARIASYEARITGLAARVAALAGRIKALTARIAALKDLLAQLLELQDLLVAAGIHGFHYVGPVNGFASELGDALGVVTREGSDLAQGFVFATTATSPRAALSKVFGVPL